MNKIDALVELGFSREEILAKVLGTATAPASLLVAVGDKVLIETPTKFWSGRVAFVDSTKIALDTAAWIANTGRYMPAIAKGDFDEVEPVPQVTIAVGAVIAVLPIPALPTVQK